MTNKAVLADRHQLADERVAPDARTRADQRAFLDLGNPSP